VAVRWRCHRRACRRVSHVRRTTTRGVAPRCGRCGNLMRVDRYRTSRRDSRNRRGGLCGCRDLVNYRHRRLWCEAERVRQYERSGPPDPEVPF